MTMMVVRVTETPIDASHSFLLHFDHISLNSFAQVDDDYDEPQQKAYTAPSTATTKQSNAPSNANPSGSASAETISAVKAIVGDDSFSDSQIRMALQRYDANVERAVNALLGGYSG